MPRKSKKQGSAGKRMPPPPKAPRTPPAPTDTPPSGADAKPAAPAEGAPAPESPPESAPESSAVERKELVPASLTSPGGAKMKSYTQQAYSLLSGRYPGLIDDALSRSILGVFKFASTGSGSHALPAEFDGLEPIAVHVSIRRIPGPSFPTDGVICEAQFDDDTRQIDVNVSPSGLMYTGFALFQKGDAA